MKSLKLKNKKRATYDIYWKNFKNINIIKSLYKQNNLPYHNWKHIKQILKLISKRKDLSEKDIHILTYTTLYHDIVYKPLSKTNERDSVNLFDKYEDVKYKDEIKELILFTKYQRKPKTRLEKIFLELDMHIFSLSKKKQLKYEALIRKEYFMVPYGLYLVNRIEILKTIKTRYGINTNKLIKYLEKQI